MSYTRTIERRDTVADVVLPPMAGGELRLVGGSVRSAAQQARYAADLALDQVLADSFPASDPPSWTPGIARPVLPDYTRRADIADDVAGDVADNIAGDAATEGDDRKTFGVKVRSDVIDLSLPRTTRTFLHALVSFAGAVGLVLLAPLVILLIGLPIALAVRGIAEAVGVVLARIMG